MAVVESVYNAVRTDCLYKADCVWSLGRLISQNRQRPLVYTALTDWFLWRWWKVFTTRYGLIAYIKRIVFGL